ncbi:MAG: hypothetical protein HKN21_07295, partial [Candidatus Eisenbacteria bacterium]|nr:hypothetical protein [Candidatus Eisenbacteria bacterium]
MEIAEGGEGISSSVLVRQEDGQTVTRITKTVAGESIFFDWIHTKDFSREFKFSATEPLPLDPTRFRGAHALYVRSVDNNAAPSLPDQVSFTTTTVAPTTRIDSPLGDVLAVGENIRIQWSGVDPDYSGENPGPVAGFEYKIVRLDLLDPPVPVITADPDFVLVQETPNIPWVRTRDVELALATDQRGSYMIGVRSIDEAGAIDPFLNLGGENRNVLRFQVLGGASVPDVCVSEETLGELCLSEAETREVDVVSGKSYAFDFSCDASTYGSSIEGLSYGVNVTDVDDDSQWSDYSLVGRTEAIATSGKEPITISFRCLDDFGVRGLGSIKLLPVEFSFEYDVLVIDDFRDAIWPRDEEHDAFWMRILAGSGKFSAENLDPEVAMHHVHGVNDVQSLDPQTPGVDKLANYKLVIYNTRASGYNARSSLLEESALSRSLRLYLTAGGKLWVIGEATVAATIPSQANTADFVYPKEMAPGQFAYDFLKLRTDNIWNDKNADNTRNGLIHATGNVDHGLFDMNVDPLKLSPIVRQDHGVGMVDALFAPIALEKITEGELEILYRFGAVDLRSTYHRRAVAIRWSDDSETRAHGRVAWFGFPVYFFEETEFQPTFNTMVDWFQAGP